MIDPRLAERMREMESKFSSGARHDFGIRWVVGTPLSDARLVNGDKVSRKIWKRKLPGWKRGDVLDCLMLPWIPIEPVEIRFNSIESFYKTLNKAWTRPLDPENEVLRVAVYDHIARGFPHPAARVEKIWLFEQSAPVLGSQPGMMAGDLIFGPGAVFDGVVSRTDEGVWMPGVHD